MQRAERHFDLYVGIGFEYYMRRDEVPVIQIQEVREDKAFGG